MNSKSVALIVQESEGDSVLLELGFNVAARGELNPKANKNPYKKRNMSMHVCQRRDGENVCERQNT